VKVVAVTSGKGGTGKSVVAAYLGMALADRGQRVLLLELGSSFRSLDLITGMQNSVVLDTGDVLLRGAAVEDAAVVCDGYDGNLALLAAGINGERCWPDQFTQLLDRLGDAYDCVVVDGVELAAMDLAQFHTILMVLTPDSLCVRACAHHARALYAGGAQNLRLVINNVPPRILPMYGAQDFDDVIDMVGAQLIGVIPASPKLQYSSNNAQPLDEETLTVKVFENMAARLMGEQRPLLVR